MRSRAVPGVDQAPGSDVGGRAGPAEQRPGGDGDVDQGGQRGLAAGLVERRPGRRPGEPGGPPLVLLLLLLLVIVIVIVVGARGLLVPVGVVVVRVVGQAGLGARVGGLARVRARARVAAVTARAVKPGLVAVVAAVAAGVVVWFWFREGRRRSQGLRWWMRSIRIIARIWARVPPRPALRSRTASASIDAFPASASAGSSPAPPGTPRPSPPGAAPPAGPAAPRPCVPARPRGPAGPPAGRPWPAGPRPRSPGAASARTLLASAASSSDRWRVALPTSRARSRLDQPGRHPGQGGRQPPGVLAAMSMRLAALRALAAISKPSSSAGYSPSRDRTRSPPPSMSRAAPARWRANPRPS